MSLTLTGMRSATRREWDEIWQGCAYATYFHSREWAEIWERASGSRIRPVPRLISFSDGKEALLPLSYERTLKGLGRRYVSSPAGTYGGWISLDVMSSEHAAAMCTYLTRRLGAILWRLNPYDPLTAAKRPALAEEDETQVLDLSCGVEAIHRRWTRGHQSAARQGRHRGVLVAAASDKNDWRIYFDIYRAALQRWGRTASSVYKWTLFREMYASRSPHITLWLARKKGRILGGIVCFSARRHLVLWHGVARAQYFDCRPMHVLIHHLMEIACSRGHRWFDFNPSGGHAGVAAFKKGFGAGSLSCPVVNTTPRIAHVAHKLGRRAAEILGSGVSVLPPLTNPDSPATD